MQSVLNTVIGRIVYVNAETGNVGIETRLGERLLVERLLVESRWVEAMGLEVAVHCLNGVPFSVQSLTTWYRSNPR